MPLALFKTTPPHWLFHLFQNDGSTPLYAAATNGHKEIFDCLLEKGADVNAATVRGFMD